MNHTDANRLLAGQTAIAMPGKATLLTRIDGNLAIVLYETAILTWRQDGTIDLDYGAYRTNLTKDRMNTYLETWRVYARARQWYAWQPAHPDRAPLAFKDGRLTLPAD